MAVQGTTSSSLIPNTSGASVRHSFDPQTSLTLLQTLAERTSPSSVTFESASGSILNQMKKLEGKESKIHYLLNLKKDKDLTTIGSIELPKS